SLCTRRFTGAKFGRRCGRLKPDVSPEVSVVMAAYNDAAYLVQAMDSLLGQRFRDFEVIVFDDASTDATWEILSRYAQQDGRVRAIQNAANMGLTASLNQGFALAQGKYIARMDADDVSLTHRLGTQVAYMNAHPTVAACGSWVKTIGNPSGHVWRHPTQADEVRYSLLFRSVLVHPTVVIRRSVMEQLGMAYNPAYVYAQDYALWAELAQQFPLVNLPQVLLQYRCHARQRGQAHQADQQAVADQVRRQQLAHLEIAFTASEFECHRQVGTHSVPATVASVEAAEAWLLRLSRYCQDRDPAATEAIRRVFGREWFGVCDRTASLGRWVWYRFRASPLSQGAEIPLINRLKFALKCLR
ncbi:MAG: glycosyltransferase family 2 protein, partial [Cyanobacteria bacterium J06632_22]